MTSTLEAAKAEAEAAELAAAALCQSSPTPIRIAAKKPRDVFCLNKTWKPPEKTSELHVRRGARARARRE